MSSQLQIRVSMWGVTSLVCLRIQLHKVFTILQRKLMPLLIRQSTRLIRPRRAALISRSKIALLIDLPPTLQTQIGDYSVRTLACMQGHVILYKNRQCTQSGRTFRSSSLDWWRYIAQFTSHSCKRCCMYPRSRSRIARHIRQQ